MNYGIDSKKIGLFINFLHKYKHGYKAPKDLIESWKKLPESRINKELDLLFEQWGFDQKQKKEILYKFDYNRFKNVPYLFILLILIVLIYLII